MPSSRPSLEIGSDAEIALNVLSQLKHNFGDVVSAGNNFFCWDKTHWRELTEPELYGYIVAWDGAARPGRRARVEISAARLKSIKELLHKSVVDPEFFLSPSAGVPVADGFILIDKDITELVPHSPEYRNRYILESSYNNRSYDPDDDNLLLNTLLRGCFEGDPEADLKCKILQEIAGAILIGATRALTEPRAIVLLGPKASNGKSQVLDMFRGLVPDYAHCCLSPADMDDKKLLCTLEGKLLNAADEVGGRAIGSEVFKSVVTGNLVNARGIYRDAVFFRPMAQQIFTCNELPSFRNGMDRGVRRRLMIVRFDRTIPKEQQIHSIGLLIAEHESDSLLSWAIGGAKRLMKQGDFTDLPSSAMSLRDWIRIDDPFAEWLADAMCVAVTGNSDDRVEADLAYKAFRIWCEKVGIRDVHVPAQPSLIRKINDNTYKDISTQRKTRGRWIEGLILCHPNASNV
jgi:P4 family phage/plasmid primase-like protien